MRFISTRVHGALDYLMGLLLIAAPWIFGFDDISTATWIPVILGVGVILYSLATDYEWGMAHALSMPTHLWLDGLGGLFLAASPWLFGFSYYVWLPHLVFGLLEIGAALFTETTPAYRTAFGT